MLEKKVSRRRFVGCSVAAAAAFTIVPRHVLGGRCPAPSDTLGGALIGCGGRGGAPLDGMGPHVQRLADCDVKYLDKVDNS